MFTFGTLMFVSAAVDEAARGYGTSGSTAAASSHNGGLEESRRTDESTSSQPSSNSSSQPNDMAEDQLPNESSETEI